MSVFLCLFITLLICIVYRVWNIYNYWRRKCVVGPTPLPFFGNYISVILRRETEADLLRRIYEQYPNEKYVGVYKGTWPALVIRDPCLIKKVVIRDFDFFQDRCVEEPAKFLNRNLLAMRADDKWKALRFAVSPAFTKSKLAKNIPAIKMAVDKYVNLINQLAEAKSDIDMKYALDKYSLENVGTIIYGLDINAFEEFSQFQKATVVTSDTQLKASAVHTMHLVCPSVLKLLTPLIRKELFKNLEVFRKLLDSLLHELRKKNKEKFNSLLDFMVELKDNSESVDGTDLSLFNDDAIREQALIYTFVAYESTARAALFMIHVLIQNQNVQEKCYEEIKSVLGKFNGELTIDSLSEMKYLEMVFDEMLRMHPLTQNIDRMCTSKYTFRETNLTIDEDVMMLVPLHGLHRDPNYYPNPNIFEPERFSPQNKCMIPQCVYLPFGEGPRFCIGFRMAKITVLIGIAGLLLKFKLLPSKKTKLPLKYDPNILISSSPLGSIWSNVERRT